MQCRAPPFATLALATVVRFVGACLYICHANYINGDTFSRMSELHDNLKKLMPPDFRYKIKDIESSNNSSRLRFVSSVLPQKYVISG